MQNRGSMQQLAIPLPDQLVTDVSTLLIEEENRSVWGWLSSWPNWPLPQVAVIGSAGSGKTHMAQALAALSKGCSFIVDSSQDPLVLVKSSQLILIDDYDRFDDESWLFHIYNLAKEHGCQVVYFGQSSPADHPFVLKDLASRLRSLPCLEIHEPGDDLFRELLRKELLNRGLICGDEVIEYIYRRFDRSYQTIHKLVKLIDEHTLFHQHPLTLPLLKDVMDQASL